jgi:hypothetical protein
MADCDSVDNITVSVYSGVSLRLLGVHGSASRFLERAVYASSAEVEA